ncbi:hypothetical protein [Pelagovum pacificum]|uniref:hypothetical protein n=1 Tax=Pelagovum pacificum TaxID=2588711 RepID=UPI0018CE82EA|nr:hypothetical protein [Pelagovum pacificum]QQA43773.1 hypothetical protein I8N54_04135 [Pelagovum pacificum]
MKDVSRVIERIRSEADRTKVSMPWERGVRRESFIAKRRLRGDSSDAPKASVFRIASA